MYGYVEQIIPFLTDKILVAFVTPVIGASTNYEDPHYSGFSAPPLTPYAQHFAEHGCTVPQ